MWLLTSLDHGKVDPCLFAHSSFFSSFGHNLHAPSSQTRNGEERKKPLGPRVVAAISDIERGLSAVAALLEIGNMWPSKGDDTSAKGERGVGVGVGEKR